VSIHDAVQELAARYDVAEDEHSLQAYGDLTEQLHVVSSAIAQLGVEVAATLDGREPESQPPE